MDGLRTALFAKLNGDVTLTDMLATSTSIYHRRAPSNAQFPFIIIDKQSGSPTWTFKGRPMSSELWQVKGVDRAESASKAEDIDRRIDVVLTDAAMQLSDGALMYIRRETDINYGEENDPDYVVHHIGASYRAVIDRA